MDQPQELEEGWTVVRIRVLVVDDSVVVRKLVTDTLQDDPDIEVVGTAANGRIALDKIARLQPDLVTLDIEMPVMDGLETLTNVRREHPGLPVIMFSTLTERGAAATLTALERGASDYVTKPANVGSIAESKEAVRAQLVPRIHALCRRKRVAAGPASRAPRPMPAAGAGPAQAGRRPRIDVVVIGCSTGGPDALSTLLPALPATLPVPVLVTQHIPPVFSKQLAGRLDTKSALAVSEAVAGERIEAGRVLIAPGDWHLRVGGRPGSPVAVLDQGPQENFCRPAVDVLFRSAAEVFGPHVLAVVLTGMGSDGARGAAAVRSGGGQVVAQDEDTSVVWGMPGAAVAAGVVDQVVPLSQVAALITGRCALRRTPWSGVRSVGSVGEVQEAPA